MFAVFRTQRKKSYANFLPDDNFLDLPKFKAFADDKLNVSNSKHLQMTN